MADLTYRYVAVDPHGRRIRGVLSAAEAAVAYDRLKRDGLSPVSLKAHRRREHAATASPRLRSRDAAEFLSSLSDLLRAGADIRTALSILGAKAGQPALRQISETLSADISSGEPLDGAFSRVFQTSHPSVAPLIAAGEASGDLPGGLQRASKILSSEQKLRDQLLSALAYPTFVAISAAAAVLAILLYIVPSIAPLAVELGSEPSMSLRMMIAASDLLTANMLTLGLSLLGGVIVVLAAARAGLLKAPVELLLLDGPCRRTVGGIVFGNFAQSLGAMIAAGAPVVEALRLATRTTSMRTARERLDAISQAVRQGEPLSAALEGIANFPQPIVRLTTVGEASNALGPMLLRGGRMEEDAALRRIEAAGRMAGPALIVLLGVILGILMGGLLSGVSEIGQSALS